MNEWEHEALNKSTRKLGPELLKCLKCSGETKVQTWPSPVYLVQQIGAVAAIGGPPAIAVFAKACRECGFIELYCPDAIEAD